MSETPGPRAAAVAAQLLEFLREPARYRPAWIHGEAPLPEGHVVLKFALGRFSPGWRRDLSKHDKDALVEAAQAFVRQVCLWERSTHYQVLGLAPGAPPDDVRENYRLLMALLHPDRQPGSVAVQWPTGCAQRVNEAYATLSDPRLRAQYDGVLEHSHPAIELHLPLPQGSVVRRRRGSSYFRSFAVVSGVIVTLFLVQAWWVDDTPRHLALLERTLPGSSAKWMHEVMSDGMPRFLDSRPAMSFDPIELLQAPKIPRRLVTWVPMEPQRTQVATAASAAAGEKAATSSVSGVTAGAAAEAPPAPRLILAQATAATSPSSASPTASVTGSPSAKDIELLVARLVSYYEQGDAGGLMALFASGEPGFLKGWRVRSAYSDFFRATKDRRLRMDRLEWQAGADTARARGEATLVAEQADGGGRLERKVPVELDIAMRDGEARLTRLRLYPETQ
jgi:hypothetical protein